MHRANARTGQHRNGGFRHHWHIDGDHIAFFDAECLQRVGEPADIGVQFAVANVLALRGVVAFPDNGRLVGTLRQMTIKAVCRQVQLTVFKPFNGDITGGKGGVFDFGVGGHPVKDFTFFAPECFRIADGLLVFRLVLLRVYQAIFRNSSGNRVFVYLAHGFCSPCRMLIICRKNVNCRGSESFVYYLRGRSRIAGLSEKTADDA